MTHIGIDPGKGGGVAMIFGGASDQTELMNNLIAQGRQVKAQMKRERRARRATEQAQVEASES